MVIKLENVCFRYPEQKALALRDLSTTVGSGIHLLLGENGAGKTTFLHLIAGLLFPSSGECRIDGARTRYRLPSITSHVCFLGDNPHFPAKSVNEMAKIHAKFYPSFSKEQLCSNLEKFNMTGNEAFSEMSYGARKKATLAYILSLGTEITLLDEPANGLDIESKQALQQIILECFDNERTLIISTHTFSDFQTIFDNIIVLHEGLLRISSAIDDILSKFTFSMTDCPHPETIFTEPRLGGFISMLPNNNGVPESDIDFGLLYNALHNEKSYDRIINFLNNKQ